MKLTKLLAMLLALCMILCCFAACGGDKKDDDKDEKTEATDDKKETEPATEADAELEGKWMMNIDLGEAYQNMMMMSDEEIDLELPPLDFVIEWNFADDGNYTATAVEYPSDEDAAAFFKVIMKFTMDAMKEMFSEDDLEDLLAEEGYDSLDAYIDATLEAEIEGMIDEMHKTSEMFAGEYELDGDVIKVTDELNEIEAKITFKISGNEMTFVEVEDEMETFTVFSGAKLTKK